MWSRKLLTVLSLSVLSSVSVFASTVTDNIDSVIFSLENIRNLQIESQKKILDLKTQCQTLESQLTESEKVQENLKNLTERQSAELMDVSCNLKKSESKYTIWRNIAIVSIITSAVILVIK